MSTKRAHAPSPATPPTAVNTRTASTPVAPPPFTTFARLARSKSFPHIADRAIELRKLVAVGDAAKEELKKLVKDELEDELAIGGVPENVTIDYHGVKIRIADEGSGTRIDPDILVRLKVSRKIIEEATVPNARKHYVEISLPLEVVNEVLRDAELPKKESKRARRDGGE